MSSEFPSVQLLGKHPVNTQADTSTNKRQRRLYTPPVGWKPPISATGIPHYPSAPTTLLDISPIPPHATVTTPPDLHTLGMKVWPYLSLVLAIIFC